RWGGDGPYGLGAGPCCPFTGARLLAPDASARATLAAAIERLCLAEELSSAHGNFRRPDEATAFGPGWHERLALQYHGRNVDGWRDFGEVLGALCSAVPQHIRQERARRA